MNAPKHPLTIDSSLQIPNKAFRSKWERILGETESPIEAAFLEAFCDKALDKGYLIGPAPCLNDTIGVKPQKQLDTYRLDFAIVFHFHGAWLQIDVECDGHDFHERTQLQAKRDRRRDRALGALDYEVMRFTGSEIFANSRLCAQEVLDRIMTFQTTQIVNAKEAADGQD